MTKTQKFVFCNQRCYITAEGNVLVPHGHEDATALFSVRGRQHPTHTVEHFTNGDDFFQDEAPEPEVPSEDLPKTGTRILRLSSGGDKEGAATASEQGENGGDEPPDAPLGTPAAVRAAQRGAKGKGK